ncbi:MAG: hypothetical protein PQJ61_14590 [Spirochaetales bacterium]|uniref:Uncharacterized protein n=1 Tax=Candidatus Thalassospirochaeta sargassi TaxID=3119039 RepID=A0AAJ1MNM7_9SPIO|nr:hypothetical protein [Spirochaetales bacterium]
MFLTVIKPPNNAGTALSALKHQLYLETGLLSAGALAPMVPVALSSEVKTGLISKNLPRLPEEGLQLESVRMLRGQLCLASDGLESFCEDIEGVLKGLGGYKRSFCSLHLAECRSEGRSSGASTAAAKLVRELPQSVKTWKSCSLEIYRFEDEPFADPDWWKRVVYETVCSVRFRKAQKR